MWPVVVCVAACVWVSHEFRVCECVLVVMVGCMCVCACARVSKPPFLGSGDALAPDFINAGKARVTLPLLFGDLTPTSLKLCTISFKTMFRINITPEYQVISKLSALSALITASPLDCCAVERGFGPIILIPNPRCFQD